ncbi:MAG: hypothetical protein WCV62_02785 [Candidatus Peribacteraceae bacterium]|jgi:hypothetical protein
MHNEEYEIAWEEFVKAYDLHVGHGEEGKGSPITDIAYRFRGAIVEQIIMRNELEKGGVDTSSAE